MVEVSSIKELGKAVKREADEIAVAGAGLADKILEVGARLTEYETLGYTPKEAYHLVSHSSFKASLILELTKDYEVRSDASAPARLTLARR